MACDVYHVWWDPKLEQQIARAGKKRLLAYHICDWLVPTRDLLNDRGMMGDGVIDLPLHSLLGRARRLQRLPGSGDLLRARLVEARPGRGAAYLRRTRYALLIPYPVRNYSKLGPAFAGTTA